MAVNSVVEVRQRWWLGIYLRWVIIRARITRRWPDMNAVESVIRRGVYVRRPGR